MERTTENPLEDGREAFLSPGEEHRTIVALSRIAHDCTASGGCQQTLRAVGILWRLRISPPAPVTLRWAKNPGSVAGQLFLNWGPDLDLHLLESSALYMYLLASYPYRQSPKVIERDVDALGEAISRK